MELDSMNGSDLSKLDFLLNQAQDCSNSNENLQEFSNLLSRIDTSNVEVMKVRVIQLLKDQIKVKHSVFCFYNHLVWNLLQSK